ncbi:hypothetical protein BRDID11004_23510 [Bradyrhizobium diazoefficiens]|uniref:Uncharacterized protein n=1 Tax=Bradyrhizobium diazoefficiens TaxID=1355477 RepID=A0A810AUL8_9BRAD|nr:hypothetical protein F07S3_65730 [Bradyrhizobium diazoefficiens]BCA05823.1 hypothetical protein H12S4_67270 [Bradyrhizobium diazoefficiens]BCA14425.1 hypothetical protein BDHF08_62720 [Bradyrhizobium diazoefficiens]BCA23176.1 hypothetical protein BDHH15_63910 [Bradyrhizobium diazoefficiens]BCE32551.1 hypothetical protein XF2B_63200 [Bradyrhizobium diazoefficiens]
MIFIQIASTPPLGACRREDILLVIDSLGGSVEPAYLIGKTLKRLAAKKFAAAVPRRAKVRGDIDLPWSR